MSNIGHRYQLGRPTQEVRLRNWKPGQAAQFKKSIEILEGELNIAMAAQVDQGGKRVFVASIPKVTGLSVTAGFKSFQIKFNPAKGIQNLLFYEVQKDTSSSFANPTVYTIPQTTLTIPTGNERETIYIRVRVINSKFQVGQWSAIDSATGSSNFRINTTRGDRTTLEIDTADFNTWIDVQTLLIPTTTAAISVSAQPGVRARMSFETTAAPPSRRRNSYYTIKFRLLKDGIEYTNAGQSTIFATSIYQNDAEEGGNAEYKEETTVFGVIISPLVTYTNSETVEFILQAYVLQDSGTWEFTGSSDQDFNLFQVIDNPIVVIDNFDVLEVIQVT